MDNNSSYTHNKDNSNCTHSKDSNNCIRKGSNSYIHNKDSSSYIRNKDSNSYHSSASSSKDHKCLPRILYSSENVDSSRKRNNSLPMPLNPNSKDYLHNYCIYSQKKGGHCLPNCHKYYRGHSAVGCLYDTPLHWS